MWSSNSCPSGKTVSVAAGSGGDASSGGGTNEASWFDCEPQHCWATYSNVRACMRAKSVIDINGGEGKGDVRKTRTETRDDACTHYTHGRAVCKGGATVPFELNVAVSPSELALHGCGARLAGARRGRGRGSGRTGECPSLDRTEDRRVAWEPILTIARGCMTASLQRRLSVSLTRPEQCRHGRGRGDTLLTQTRPQPHHRRPSPS